MRSLPKIELHCHLDGSLRPETVRMLAEKNGVKHPYETIRELTNVLIAPADCDSLDTYLKRFELPISVMQTSDALTQVTFELMEDAAKESVKYIEIRFAPQLHTAKGLTLEQIIESVIHGIRQAEEKYDIKGNVILSYLRNTTVEGFFDVINAGKRFVGHGVVAVDLCGGERDRFSERFIEPVAYARELGYHVTVHAGETGIAANMKDAVELLHAERLGHGVAMFSDREVLEFIKEKGVFIESCPTSNVQTKAVTKIADHPIDYYYGNQIKLTINTDNRTVSNTTMSNEYALLEKTFCWMESHWKNIYLTSVEASFADEATKQYLLESLKERD